MLLPSEQASITQHTAGEQAQTRGTVPGWGGGGEPKTKGSRTLAVQCRRRLPAVQGDVNNTCGASCRSGLPCTGAGVLQDKGKGGRRVAMRFKIKHT